MTLVPSIMFVLEEPFFYSFQWHLKIKMNFIIILSYQLVTQLTKKVLRNYCCDKNADGLLSFVLLTLRLFWHRSYGTLYLDNFTFSLTIFASIVQIQLQQLSPWNRCTHSPAVCFSFFFFFSWSSFPPFS